MAWYPCLLMLSSHQLRFVLKRGIFAVSSQSSMFSNLEQENCPENGLSEEEPGKDSKPSGRLPTRAPLNEKNESFFTFTEVRHFSPLPCANQSYPGAYYLSSAAAQRLISIPLAKYTDSRVFGKSPSAIAS